MRTQILELLNQFENLSEKDLAETASWRVMIGVRDALCSQLPISKDLANLFVAEMEIDVPRMTGDDELIKRAVTVLSGAACKFYNLALKSMSKCSLTYK